MKKIFLLCVVAAVIVTSCKKKDNVQSQTYAVSYPTILISGAQYYSINVNGTLPNITGTAYDSVYDESTAVVINQSGIDNTTPGLYAVTATSSNKYGMTAYKTIFVAVTNISDSLNLAGFYLRNGNPVFITKLARGLFMTSNVGGDDTATQASSIIPAVFAVTSDTTIDFGSQITSSGTLTASMETLSLAPGDTTLSYAVSLTGFGTQVRTFVKQ